VTAVSTGPAPDFQALSGTLIFLPGETAKTIAVPVNGDTFKEINESFNVTLSNAKNATIAQGLGQGTIVDDGDTDIGVGVFGVITQKVAEGDSGTKTATFRVQLSAASTVPVTVDLTTRDGTATAGSDYATVTKTLTFTP